MNIETRTTPVKRAERPPADTRERALDVAERLFSERSLEAVPIRDTTGAAFNVPRRP